MFVVSEVQTTTTRLLLFTPPLDNLDDTFKCPSLWVRVLLVRFRCCCCHTLISLAHTHTHNTHAGTVYAAISDHGDTVAVKNIDKILMRKKKKESDVNHELGIQVWLSQSKKERAQYEGAHANISSLIEIFEEPHQMNIVVEIAENGSFFDLCKNKFAGGSPFTEEEARHYFRQILSGVNFCHKKGISHRDLKPENLLLGGPLGNTIKICDFGLANWVQESEKEIQRARSSVENDRSFGTSSSSGKSSSGFLGFLGRKSGDESEISHEQSHIDTTAFNAADARYLQTCGKGT